MSNVKFKSVTCVPISPLEQALKIIDESIESCNTILNDWLETLEDIATNETCDENLEFLDCDVVS